MVLAALVSAAGLPDLLTEPAALELYRVREMLDGGMGSLRFVTATETRRVTTFGIAQRWYTDVDGVPVSFALSLDDRGEPWEIDAWKVDFSALKRPPASAADLRTTP